MKTKKEIIIFVLIIALGFFLRFYRFMPNFMFNGEMGTDYMNIWNIIHGSRTFLIGPRTSHEWFFISPLAYWIYTVLLLLWNYNIVVVNVFWGIIGSLAVLVCYATIKKIFNKNVALISSFLIAVSPAWIMQTRYSRYNLVAAILFLPYLLYLRNSIKDKGKSLLKLGLILGLTMSFFPSPLLLIPATIVSFLFYRVKPKLKYVLYFILGFTIPNITFLFYEISDKFSIVIQMFTWIPYRVLGFFGLYQKNTVDSTILSQNFNSIYKFFSESFVGYTGILSMTIFIVIIGSTLYLLEKSFKDKEKQMPFLLLVINLVVCYLGLFIHGDPPPHYYLVIFPIPMLLAAYMIDKYFRKNTWMMVGSTLVLGAVGIFGLVHTNWFFIDKQPINYDTNAVPYVTQLKIADIILKNSNGASLALKRIGIDDEFENDYANNYIYLLTTRGAKIDANSGNIYTIIERKENYQEILGKIIFSEDDVYVFKNN